MFGSEFCVQHTFSVSTERVHLVLFADLKQSVYALVLIHAFWCQIECTSPWKISTSVKPQWPKCLRLCRVKGRHVAGAMYFFGSFHLSMLSHSVFLQVSAWLRIALQTQVLLLRQGAAVVLWESIHTLVLLLNPGYVNHEQTSLTHNDSPQFNCVTGLIQGIMSNVCEGEYVRRWLRHLIDF